MKTLKIEGYKVETNLDEVRYNGCENGELEGELYACGLIEFMEQVGIEGIPVSSYFYEHRKGYKDRRLEPFNWRSTKKTLTLSYTGAMGGAEWYAKVFLT